MKWKVLVVDDEAANLQLLHNLLKNNYQLSFAKNGQDAIRLAHEERPNLILLDVMMPEMDGYEVCQRLKENELTKDIPIIFVTALSDSKDEQMGFDLGAVDYILKPISAPIVLKRVQCHIQLYNQKLACQKNVKEKTAELEKTRLKIIQKLGRAAEYKDNETGLHVIRMSHYSKIIASSIGWNDEELDMLLHAAPMHDIGKIGIADNILTKPGKLTKDEWTVMKSHPEIGASILGESEDGIIEMARQIALSHHEKWDGSGYPYNLAAEEIPIEGRIVAIADVFDALTTERPYKSAWSVDESIKLIRESSGSHFDPILVEAFTDSLEKILEVKNDWSEDSAPDMNNSQPLRSNVQYG